MIYTDFLDETELKTLAQAMNNRARIANKSGTVTSAILRDCIYKSGGICQWCHTSIVGQSFEVDHIIPLYRGGGNIADNIAVACPTCNRSKSDKHPARFAQETYARTGIMTALIERVLAYYDIDATVQKSLFDESEDTTSIASEDDIRDDPPPYIWGQ